MPKAGASQVTADELVRYFFSLFLGLVLRCLALFWNIGHRFVTSDARATKRRFETSSRFVLVVEFRLCVVQRDLLQVLTFASCGSLPLACKACGDFSMRPKQPP